MKTAIAVVCLSVSFLAGAKPVYKCEEKGAITYTDRPCTPDAVATELPGLIVTAPPTASQRDLARAHDDRLAKARAGRDRDDAQWLEQHANRKDRDARVREAILKHRVIRSMTFDEVEQALGKPDEVQGGDSFGTAKTTWVYRKDGQRRVVNFKDGEVTTTTGRGRKQK